MRLRPSGLSRSEADADSVQDLEGQGAPLHVGPPACFDSFVSGSLLTGPELHKEREAQGTQKTTKKRLVAENKKASSAWDSRQRLRC